MNGPELLTASFNPAVLPAVSSIGWEWPAVGLLLLIAVFFLLRKPENRFKKQRPATGNNYCAALRGPAEKNLCLWDDGLIFSGFRLQGTDLRTADLYGAYLRDRRLRDRGLDGRLQPLFISDADAYAALDLSGIYLKNAIWQDCLLNGADWGRFDLSGLYLRGIGLTGIDPGELLKSDESAAGDCFLPESCLSENSQPQ